MNNEIVQYVVKDLFFTALAICGVAFLCGLLLGCTSTHDRMQSHMYFHDNIPADVCAKYPEVAKYGLFRVVSCGNAPKDHIMCKDAHDDDVFEEMVSYCEPSVINYISIHSDDLGDI